MDICFRDPGARPSLEKGIRDGSTVDRKAPVLSGVIVGGRGPRHPDSGRVGEEEPAAHPKRDQRGGGRQGGTQKPGGQRVRDDEAGKGLMGPACVAAGATCGLRRDEMGGLLKKVPTEEVTWKGQAMPIKSGAPEGEH